MILLKSLISNKYVQIALALIVVMIALTVWKHQIIMSYEQKKQAEIKQQVKDDEKNIQDIYSGDIDAINNSVNGMLANDTDRLYSFEQNPCNANRLDKKYFDLGAQDGLLYFRTGEETQESELLQGINDTNPCFGIKDCE